MIRNQKGNRNPNWKGGKVKTSCVICGKTIFLKRKDIKTENCCSRFCSGKWNSQRWKRKRQEKKAKSEHRCANCRKKVIPQGLIDGHTGKEIKHFFCNKQCFSEWKRKTTVGENNPNWRNGFSSLATFLYNCEENRRWREEVRKRDGYKCRKCAGLSTLQVHHINKLNNLIKDFYSHYDQFSPVEDKNILYRLAIKWKPFWDIKNGETLCERCHAIHHAEGRCQR